jgi:micrococcal nuclease
VSAARPRPRGAATGAPRRPRRRRARGSRPWRSLARRLALVVLVLAGVPQIADALMGLRPAQADCRVVQVIDGDTVELHCPDEGFLRVRITGFDTPELFSPGCASEAAAAVSAQWHLRRTLWGAERLEVRFKGEDRYGRRLAELRVDGVSVADRMIAAGHARPYQGGRRGGWCAA